MCILHHEVSRVKQSQRAQAAYSVQEIATLALHSITPSRCACAWYRAMLHSTNLQQTHALECEPKGTSSTASTVGGASMLFTYTWYFLSPCSTQCSPKMGERLLMMLRKLYTVTLPELLLKSSTACTSLGLRPSTY